jgi:hypothetical protein
MFERYQLHRIGNDYAITLYLPSDQEEFATEFEDDHTQIRPGMEQHVRQFLTARFPNLRISTARIMLGTVLLSTLPLTGCTTIAGADNPPALPKSQAVSDTNEETRRDKNVKRPIVKAPLRIDNRHHGKFTVSGVAKPNARLTIHLVDRNNTDISLNTIADESGRFSLTLDAGPLVDGPVQLIVDTHDDAGNASLAARVTQTLEKDTSTPARPHDPNRFHIWEGNSPSPLE